MNDSEQPKNLTSTNSRLVLIDFDARLHLDVEGSEAVIRDAKDWFSEFVSLAHGIKATKKEAIEKQMLQAVAKGTEESRSKPEVTRARSRKGKARVSSAMVETTISLNSEELEDFSEFVCRYAKPESGEDCLLWIGIFLREKLGKTEFSQHDMEAAYNQLISSGADVATVKDVAHTISNMMVPSRKKQWVKSLGGGRYQISPAGILYANRRKKEKEREAKGQ
jgi:hypothetical protein